MSVDTVDRRYTYEMKISCDTPLCATVAQISGKTQRGCLRSAEADGWTISSNKISARCPACTRKMRGKA